MEWPHAVPGEQLSGPPSLLRERVCKPQPGFRGPGHGSGQANAFGVPGLTWVSQRGVDKFQLKALAYLDPRDYLSKWRCTLVSDQLALPCTLQLAAHTGSPLITALGPLPLQCSPASVEDALLHFQQRVQSYRALEGPHGPDLLGFFDMPLLEDAAARRVPGAADLLAQVRPRAGSVPRLSSPSPSWL